MAAQVAPLDDDALNSRSASKENSTANLHLEPRSLLNRKANILLVDDREDKLLAMEAIVSELGENIIKASSGKEALRYLLKDDCAVILLDVNMPGMDGFETALYIRQRSKLENIPIIFVSAISDADTHVSRGYSLGAVDYILTPIVPEILRAKVSVFVQLHKITDQVKRQAEDLQLAHSELEKRVSQRTKELAVANRSLQNEIVERQRAEEGLRILNSQLEQRVVDRTEELRSVNRELETFTYSIAHDLRAPFRQIHGYAEILEEEFSQLMPEEAKTYLNRIRVKSKEMERMVDDLLNLFVVTKQTVEFERLNLTDVAKEVYLNLKSENANRSIDFSVTELPTRHCNYALIRQVFDNLISNAIKYTRPRTQAKIRVGCTVVDGESVIFVEDNGVGFKKEYHERLFGVFQRLHKADEFEGTGVGLALCARIIEKHGGRIWAVSDLDQGATFYFTLPEGRHDQR